MDDKGCRKTPSLRVHFQHCLEDAGMYFLDLRREDYPRKRATKNIPTKC